MAQTQPPHQPHQPHQPQPQSFSPPVSSPSPNSPSPLSGVAPAAKRPRLSPLPQSQQTITPQQSFSSPSFGTLQLPKVESPVNGTPTNGVTNQQNMPPPPGSMAPPPARPADKPTDTADLTDVLASSGIDVREEEAFLTQGYGHIAAAAPPPQPPRLQTTFSNSFSSQPSAGTLSAGNSFSEQQFIQQTPIQPYPTATPTAPAPPPQKTPEEIAEDERLRQNTATSKRAQYHLQDPFLATAVVESHLQKGTSDLGLKLPTGGVYRPVPDQEPITVEVAGPDGSSVVKTGKTIMDHDATLGDVISLISLACQERLRSVLDQSAAITQNRQQNSHGVVPAEWSELAVPATSLEDTHMGGTNGASSSQGANAKKRSISEVEGATDANGRKTIKLPNSLAIESHRLFDKDSAYEEGREAKRAKRNSDAVAGPSEASTPTVATPASERAPDPERKVSKKEQKKAESKLTDAVQHQQAVETARMATSNLAGRFGGKKKKYSWLTPSGPAGSRPGPSTPTKPSATAPTGGSEGGGTKITSGPKTTGTRLGEWREDDKHAAGIHIKDILLMLEVNGNSMKPIQKGYSKHTREEMDCSK